MRNVSGVKKTPRKKTMLLTGAALSFMAACDGKLFGSGGTEPEPIISNPKGCVYDDAGRCQEPPTDPPTYGNPKGCVYDASTMEYDCNAQPDAGADADASDADAGDATLDAAADAPADAATDGEPLDPG